MSAARRAAANTSAGAAVIACRPVVPSVRAARASLLPTRGVPGSDPAHLRRVRPFLHYDCSLAS